MLYPPSPSKIEKLPFSVRTSKLQFNAKYPSANEKLPFPARTWFPIWHFTPSPPPEGEKLPFQPEPQICSWVLCPPSNAMQIWHFQPELQNCSAIGYPHPPPTSKMKSCYFHIDGTVHFMPGGDLHVYNLALFLSAFYFCPIWQICQICLSWKTPLSHELLWMNEWVLSDGLANYPETIALTILTVNLSHSGFHDKEIWCINVRLSDRSKVTQNNNKF